MDERFRDRRLWIGFGALAIVFFCVAMCGLSAMATFLMRDGMVHPPAAYIQPPGVDSGAVPQPPAYGYAPYGASRHRGFGLFGAFFKLMVFGVMLLIVIGLVRRVCWGRRYCGPHYGARHPHPPWPPHGPKPPPGTGWRCGPHASGGAWPWTYHGEPEPAEGSAPTQGEDEPDDDEADYTGPQE